MTAKYSNELADLFLNYLGSDYRPGTSAHNEMFTDAGYTPLHSNPQGTTYDLSRWGYSGPLSNAWNVTGPGSFGIWATDNPARALDYHKTLALDPRIDPFLKDYYSDSVAAPEDVDPYTDQAFRQIKNTYAARGFSGIDWVAEAQREAQRQGKNIEQDLLSQYENALSRFAKTQGDYYQSTVAAQPYMSQKEYIPFGYVDQINFPSVPGLGNHGTAPGSLSAISAKAQDVLSATPPQINYGDIASLFDIPIRPAATTQKKLAGAPTVPGEWLDSDISSYFVAGGKGSPAQKEHQGTVNK